MLGSNNYSIIQLVIGKKITFIQHDNSTSIVGLSVASSDIRQLIFY